MKDKTSCIPLFTFISPQINDQNAPAAIAAIIQRGTCITAGNFTRTPTRVAAILPTTNCPSAPILNTPVLNENATERPVSIIGAAYTRVYTRYFGLLNMLDTSFP